MNLNQCVFCDAATNLNTSLTVSIDDNKVVVRICDNHAEDATVKSAREAYLIKRKKIDDLLEQAKALGLQITEPQTKSGIVIATPIQPQPRSQSMQPQSQPTQPQSQPTQPQPALAADELISPTGANVVPTSRIDGKQFQVSVNETQGVPVAPNAALSPSMLTDKLPDGALDGYAEMALVEGRSGQPLAIPQRRVDKTGTTHIAIKKSTDAELQERFKRMASDALADRTPDFARAGYQRTQRTCPVCRGACTVKQNKQNIQCPKCNGSGIISIY